MDNRLIGQRVRELRLQQGMSQAELARRLEISAAYLNLLEKGRRTFDRAERKRHYDRFQEILNEEQPYTFLYVSYALPAISKRFQGIEPAPAGIWHNFKDWYVPRALHKYSMTQGP